MADSKLLFHAYFESLLDKATQVRKLNTINGESGKRGEHLVSLTGFIDENN